VKNKREKRAGLLIAAVVAAGLALSGVAIVTDPSGDLGLRRSPPPAPASASSRTTASQARGQYIDVAERELTPEQREGTAWTEVPATPRAVPRVRYANGQRVPQEDVARVLGYDGEKVREPRPGDGDSAWGDESLLDVRRPISSEEFWAGLADADGSPASVAAIPGQDR